MAADEVSPRAYAPILSSGTVARWVHGLSVFFQGHENPRNSEKPMKFQKITFTNFSWYIYQRNYFHGMLNCHENKFLFHFKTF